MHEIHFPTSRQIPKNIPLSQPPKRFPANPQHFSPASQ